MRLDFQKKVANSQTTLPVVGALAVVLWLVLPLPAGEGAAFPSPDYGLWGLVPPWLGEGTWSLGLSLCCAAVAVYLMAELNNAHVLLRVSSRMLASMLAILLALAVGCHRFQPGSVVMLLVLLSFFPLFSTYQLPSPSRTFLVYLLLSAASLLFPRLLWMVPVYWFLQGYLRAFSLRCLVASLLGVLLPYWIWAGVTVLVDGSFGLLQLPLPQVEEVEGLDVRNVLTFALVVVLFVSGAVDFYVHQFLDKTRTRILYNVVIMHGVCVVVFAVLQFQYVATLLPLLLIDTAMVFGHFFTLTHTRFSHIYTLLLLAAAVGMVVYLYLYD